MWELKKQEFRKTCISNGTIKIKIRENGSPLLITHVYNFAKHCPGSEMLSSKSGWASSQFYVYIIVFVSYFFWNNSCL